MQAHMPMAISSVLWVMMVGSTACTCQPDRSQVVIESAWAAGAVRGQVHNDSYCDVSSIEVNVRVLGRGNQTLYAGPQTIAQSVPAGESREFQINIAVAGGIRAQVSIQNVN